MVLKGVVKKKKNYIVQRKLEYGKNKYLIPLLFYI